MLLPSDLVDLKELVEQENAILISFRIKARFQIHPFSEEDGLSLLIPASGASGMEWSSIVWSGLYLIVPNYKF